MKDEHRGHFGSKIGIILAAAGSAVGLGNIWRFPTEVGNNGGAAFILVYLAFVFLLAMPVMVCEFVVGRNTQMNTVDAFRRLAPKRPWYLVGLMGVLAGILILSFYCVVAGWTLFYGVDALVGKLPTENLEDYNASFVTDPWRPLVYVVLFLLFTHFIVSRGIDRGIERFSKLMMPLLFLIIIVLVGYSVSMPGAEKGLTFLLKPDFSKVTSKVVFSAMGQAFFSLSVGIGCLLTYASYYKKDVNLVRSAASVCMLDTMVAVLAGFIIFPAVFSVGMNPGAGPALVFVTLPQVFNSAFQGMPVLGYAFSLLFYLLLLLAALSSSISMHEIATAFIRERFNMRRRNAAIFVTCICVLLGTACSLSFGPWSGVTVGGMTIFGLFDFLTAKFMMPLGGIVMCLFVGWVMNRQTLRDELTNHGSLVVRIYGVLIFLIRYVAPLGVSIVFVNELL